MEQISLGINADVSHAELHKYQMALANKIDTENALVAAKVTVANLEDASKAPAPQHHKFAEISHKEQLGTENKNNTKVVSRVKNDFEAIKIDDSLSAADKLKVQEKIQNDAAKQIAAANIRKPDDPANPSWPPQQAPTPVAAADAANPASTPQTSTAAPSWPPVTAKP